MIDLVPQWIHPRCGEHPVWLQQLDDEVSDSGLLVRPSGQTPCAQVSARRAWSSAGPISHLKNGEPIPIVVRSERPEIRPPFQRPRQAREGAPAFDTVLDDQAQRDQMHGRRLPGTPFGPIPGILGQVAVHHSAAPPGRSDAGQRVDLDLTEYPQHPGAEGT